MEQWKTIPTFPRYEASTLGRIRNKIKGNILKGGFDSHGYRITVLSVSGKSYTKSTHRLIMLTFEGPCPPGLEVNHIDGDKTNCRFDNLEYGTRSHNQLHRYRVLNKGAPSGDKHFRSKKVGQYKDGILIKEYASVTGAAKELNVKRGGIFQAINNGGMGHGYKWKYL